MANTKISALTSATTPLAGTEVLPIVQSSATVKVATNDLTVRNIRANATTGILQVTGPTAASTRVVTVPDANFTAARTDAAQSFTGDQTLSTGNVIQGTAAKGFNFTANTPLAGMTSQLLKWYEEGTWTPTYLGLTTAGTTTYGVNKGTYVRVGRLVTVTGVMTWTAATGTGGAALGGLPFVIYNGAGEADGSVWIGTESGYTMIGQLGAFLIRGGTTASLQVYNAGSATAASVINGSVALRFCFSYPCN
jgi:hypothetical protein